MKLRILINFIWKLFYSLLGFILLSVERDYERYYPKVLGILYVASCDVEHRWLRLCYGLGGLTVNIEA